MNIPRIVLDKLYQFTVITDIEQFCLIGGAAIDTLLDPDLSPRDWDLVIIGDDDRYFHTISQLKNAGFIIDAPRRYRLSNSMDCIDIIAIHKDCGSFDIAFTKDMEFVGPFNLESLYLKMPEAAYVDQHSSLEAIRVGRIKFERWPIENENPFILLKRFLVLTGKYNIRFGKGSKNSDTVQLLHKCFDYLVDKSTTNNDVIDVEKAGCLSKLLGSILRAKEQEAFLRDLKESELIIRVCHDLHTIITWPEFYSKLVNQKIKTKADLITCILGINDSATIKSLLYSLKQRTWDSNDQAAINL